MDILRKMFKSEAEKEPDSSTSASNKDEFRKPQWFEEAETDDELFDDDRKFAFQVFTSPLEMQKHFESQLQRLLESLNDSEDGFERDLKEDFLKPGFESKILKRFEQQKDLSLDTDLDGEIYADQLHSLIQRLNPEEKAEPGDLEMGHILPSNQHGYRKGYARGAKLTDEEIIMGRIHGTISADGESKSCARPPRPPMNNKPDIMTPMTPMLPRSGMTPFGGVFDGNYQGPKLFSQSVMTKTVRKPDGSYETTKVTQDSSGHKTTTVTRMIDGRKETTVTHDGGDAAPKIRGQQQQLQKKEVVAMAAQGERNIFVTKEGYAMPRNLW
ncbi:uncharacterized protein LOC128262918 [Drosophila gunungcola]|uniref:Uncharacterized protein n=1 Tax=Drosophila gunungcola TaxID=103775 RepID=A0A9Q0BTL8_9MUSC|nr:uncharacterized protein LOC128262918 [Drosophila gunungcola]KAI8043475.1 hypothetical protein M5D96_004807 [Drosophila gunungcola]